MKNWQHRNEWRLPFDVVWKKEVGIHRRQECSAKRCNVDWQLVSCTRPPFAHVRCATAAGKSGAGRHYSSNFAPPRSRFETPLATLYSQWREICCKRDETTSTGLSAAIISLHELFHYQDRGGLCKRYSVLLSNDCKAPVLHAEVGKEDSNSFSCLPYYCVVMQLLAAIRTCIQIFKEAQSDVRHYEPSLWHLTGQVSISPAAGLGSGWWSWR